MQFDVHIVEFYVKISKYYHGQIEPLEYRDKKTIYSLQTENSIEYIKAKSSKKGRE